MSSAELTSKIRELKKLKLKQDKTIAEIETLQNEVKAEMTARNTDTIQVDVFKVTWKLVPNTRLDTKALKAERVDIYNKYTKTTEIRCFLIA